MCHGVEPLADAAKASKAAKPDVAREPYHFRVQPLVQVTRLPIYTQINRVYLWPIVKSMVLEEKNGGTTYGKRRGCH
jgi:hypothetical protein